MRGSRSHLVLVVVVQTGSTLVSLLCCHSVDSAETRTGLKGSEADFDSFREKFDRRYEATGDEFTRRQLFFQVREYI